MARIRFHGFQVSLVLVELTLTESGVKVESLVFWSTPRVLESLPWEQIDVYNIACLKAWKFSHAGSAGIYKRDEKSSKDRQDSRWFKKVAGMFYFFRQETGLLIRSVNQKGQS